MLMILSSFLFLGFMFMMSNWSMIFFLSILMSIILLFEMNFEMVEFHILSLFFGVDMLSMLLIFLSLLIFMLMLGASSKIFISTSSNIYMMLLINLSIFLIMVFSVMNLMSFYFVFEAVLIPTYMMILGWGYQPERLNAGLYLMFYTLFASLPLLVLILFFENEMNFSIMNFEEYLSLHKNFFICLIGFLAFLVKVPMFMLHLWLPKAHVEAPIAGSMILAGVLLKMGGFGLIRFFNLFYYNIIIFKSMIFSISLVGCLIVSVICMRQIDIKALIAYSSIVHMGLMVCGIFSDSYLGLCGSVIIMLGHGLCSSGMFYLSNVIYLRIMSRSMLINKGLIMCFPSFSLIWFMLVSSNMAAPPSLNLIGEIELIGSVEAWSMYSILFLMLISFLSCVYSLYLFSMTQHGMMTMSLLSMNEITMMEYVISFLHWIPLNLLFLKSLLFIF